MLLLLCLSDAVASLLLCFKPKNRASGTYWTSFGPLTWKARVDAEVGNDGDLSAGQYFVLCDKDPDPVRSAVALASTNCGCKDMFVGRAIVGIAGMLRGAEPSA